MNKLQSILDKTIDNRKVFGASFCVRQDDNVWCGAAGNMDVGSQFFVASVTKLFTAAVILNLRSKGRLTLETKIGKYFGYSQLKGLHVYKDYDYSNEITVKQLLAHTSGLPDFLTDKNKDGNTLADELFRGKDRYWTFDECLEMTRNIPARFKPEQTRKAHYSDTNYQLLGKIIEIITEKSVSDNFQELIINPLELEKTYLYSDATDNKPVRFYYKQSELHIPQAMIAFGSDGGVVSTSEELMTFLVAFFQGQFFPAHYVEEMQQWNKIRFPFQSGIGLQKFKAPLSFGVIGHSGMTGVVAFYYPQNNIYVTGTTNQAAHPDIAFKKMLKMIISIRKR